MTHPPRQIGSVVGCNTRQGYLDAVIAKRRMIKRGRWAGTWEYTLAPLRKVGKSYCFKCKGESLFLNPSGEYTEAQIEEAAQAMLGTEATVRERKEERKQRGRDALGDVDWRRTYEEGKTSGTKIGIGDEVLVNYSDGRKWERVVFVNYKNGKVAIARWIPEETSQDDLMALLNEMLGTRKRRGRKPYRYIHPDHILETRKAQG